MSEAAIKGVDPNHRKPNHHQKTVIHKNKNFLTPKDSNSKATMKLFTVLFASLFLAFVCNAQDVDTSALEDNDEAVQNAKDYVAANGCKVNVCFALDGSGSVGDKGFLQQKQFVALIAAIIGGNQSPPPGFAATQYGIINKGISPLTTDAEEFALNVVDAEFLDAGATFVSAGLGFCVGELDEPELDYDVRKIVVLGDGETNFADTNKGKLSPKSITKRFLNRFDNAAVSGVAVPPRFRKGLAKTLGIKKKMVIGVRGFPRLLDIIDDLVEEICV